LEDRTVPATFNVTALDPIAENGGFQQAFLISLSDATSGGNYTIDFSTADGTALAGIDYEGTAGTVSLSVNNSSAIIYVSAIDNDAVEENKTFVLNLSNHPRSWRDRNTMAGTGCDPCRGRFHGRTPPRVEATRG